MPCILALSVVALNTESQSSLSVASEKNLSTQNTSAQQIWNQKDPSDLSPWLKDVPLKSRRRGILPEESELYYQILGFARDVDRKRIKKASRDFLTERWKQSRYQSIPFEKFPVFVDLYEHPELYQGRPVTMTGHILRSVISKAGHNDFGVENLCEAWLYTEDSQSNPTVVVSTNFPDHFPIGEQTVDHVTVTGYIYRMYTYDARDTRRFAPLLIAHEIQWTSDADTGKNNGPLRDLLVLLFGIILLGALLGMILLKRSRQRERVRKNVAQILSESSQPNFDFEE